MRNKYFLSLILTFIAVVQCFSQSKKEQIEQLIHIRDSIIIVANNQSLKIDSLMNVLLDLNEKIEQNMQVLDTRNYKISELEKVVKKIETEKITEKHEFELKTNLLIDSIEHLWQNNIPSDVFCLSDFAESYIGLAEPIFDFDFQLIESIDEKLTGSFKSYWSKSWTENYGKGTRKIEYATGEYKNGFKNGFWKYTLCNGEKQYEGNYLNGLKQGKWTNYDLCNSSFNYSNLAMIYTISDYYQLELEISKEEIIFEKGIPNDVFYYRNDENNIVLKINYKTGVITYDNDQPLANQSIKFEYPLFTKTGNKELLIYHRNGRVAYKMFDSGNEKSEFFYNINGSLSRKCNYLNGSGKCESFGENGLIIDNYEYDFGTGKFGGECPCQ
jgi:hypothetical protein